MLIVTYGILEIATGIIAVPATAPAEDIPAAVRVEVILAIILATAVDTTGVEADPAAIAAAAAVPAPADIEAATVDVNSLANNTPAKAAAPKAIPPATK